jgi:hypothetical protein
VQAGRLGEAGSMRVRTRKEKRKTPTAGMGSSFRIFGV